MTAEEHKKNILNYSLNELEVAVAELGEKKFRAAQIFGWLAKGVKDFDDMTQAIEDRKEGKEIDLSRFDHLI